MRRQIHKGIQPLLQYQLGSWIANVNIVRDTAHDKNRTYRMALNIPNNPPKLPCAPDEAADSRENTATIPVAVIWS